MQEALIVAVLTFIGLAAWAALINIGVKALFDFFDQQAAASAPHSNTRTLAPFPLGKK
jgi:hypothetical protein